MYTFNKIHINKLHVYRNYESKTHSLIDTKREQQMRSAHSQHESNEQITYLQQLREQDTLINSHTRGHQ